MHFCSSMCRRSIIFLSQYSLLYTQELVIILATLYLEVMLLFKFSFSEGIVRQLIIYGDNRIQIPAVKLGSISEKSIQVFFSGKLVVNVWYRLILYSLKALLLIVQDHRIKNIQH